MTGRPVSTCECKDHCFVTMTQGYVAIADVDDASFLSDRKWAANICRKPGGNYVRASATVRDRTVYLHRLILPESQMVDHINGNPLDNRRRNLRAVTPVQNCHNRKGLNPLRGIFRDKARWRAEIKVNGKRHGLGSYATPEAASEAYRQASIRLSGEYAFMSREANQ